MPILENQYKKTKNKEIVIIRLLYYKICMHVIFYFFVVFYNSRLLNFLSKISYFDVFRISSL